MTRPKNGTRSGAAAVEFAVVAPVLGFLMLGVIELNQAYLVREAAGDAAKAGCRLAIKTSTTVDPTTGNSTAVAGAGALGGSPPTTTGVKNEVDRALIKHDLNYFVTNKLVTTEIYANDVKTDVEAFDQYARDNAGPVKITVEVTLPYYKDASYGFFMKGRSVKVAVSMMYQGSNTN